MKTYKFELVIKEGNDEFWESLEGKSGCDEVTEMIKSALQGVGIDVDYEHCDDKLILREFKEE